jgi:uncharacterized protein
MLEPERPVRYGTLQDEAVQRVTDTTRPTTSGPSITPFRNATAGERAIPAVKGSAMTSAVQRSSESAADITQLVGRVVALWRYPVKSMAAEALAEVEVSWHGLAGDRRWAFIRDGEVRSGFPWLTLRQCPDLSQYRPSFVEPDRPNASRTMVRTPAGNELDVVDPALAAELGNGVRVIKQDRGVFDTMPLSIITTQTIANLSALTGSDLDVLRFRPNLLIEPTSQRPFPEDAWVGCVLHIGGTRMRVDARDKRCVVVNIDPVTTRRNPAILRAIAQQRDSRVGVYGTTVQPGRITVGDPVVMQSRQLHGGEESSSQREGP